MIIALDSQNLERPTEFLFLKAIQTGTDPCDKQTQMLRHTLFSWLICSRR